MHLRVRYRIAAITLGAVCVALAACNGPRTGGGGSLTPALAPQLAVRTSEGDSAALVSRSLGTSVRIAIVKEPNAVAAAPNRAWTMLPGTLRVHFLPALQQTDEIETGLQLAMTYRPGDAARLRAGYLPLVAIAYAGGRTVRFPLRGRTQIERHLITLGIPATLLGDATGVTVALGVDNVKYKVEPPGPRYWDGKQWEKTGTIEPGKKTLVLIHGIFSSVESAFPATPTPACPQSIADAGGYKQVLGWDYDWFYPPKVEGPLFYKFLDKIADAGVTDLDVEAHSYGTLVTLAAVPMLKSIKIKHVVLLGGPLPLRGTPLAEDKNSWRMGFVLGVLDTFSDEPPSDVDKAIGSGMIASLAPNSDALTKLLDDFKSMPTKPDFFQAAGDHWICLVGYPSVCLLSEEFFKKVLIDGSGVQLPWDGVVETIAAESKDIPNSSIMQFPLSHIQLECDKDVIKWVGKQVNP